ncbi:MAG: hypothetical protein M5U08_25375 [Burkholderiales bacterium]|nr:hypothetical protein [Burkholderiales bacterium]
MREARQPLAQLQRERGRGVVLGLRDAHHRDRAAVPQQRPELGLAIGHMHRLHDRAARADAEVRDHELDQVRQLHRDHVALGDAEPLEPARERIRTRAQFRIAERASALPHRDPVGGRARRPLEPVAQQLVGPPAGGAIARHELGRIFDADRHVLLAHDPARPNRLPFPRTPRPLRRIVPASRNVERPETLSTQTV